MKIFSLCEFLTPALPATFVENFIEPVLSADYSFNPKSGNDWPLNPSSPDILNDFSTFARWSLFFLNHYHLIKDINPKVRAYAMILYQSFHVRFACVPHSSSIPMDIYRGDAREHTTTLNPVSYCFTYLYNNFCPRSSYFSSHASIPNFLTINKSNSQLFNSILQELHIVSPSSFIFNSDAWYFHVTPSGSTIAVPSYLESLYNVCSRVIDQDRAAAISNRDYYRTHKDDHYGKSIRQSVKNSSEDLNTLSFTYFGTDYNKLTEEQQRIIKYKKSNC